MIARHLAEIEANEIGVNRKLAPPAIRQDRQPNHTRASKISERAQRCPNRSAGEKHIVDQDHRPAVDLDRNIGRLHNRTRADFRQVVAIESDIKHPAADLRVAALFEMPGDALRDCLAARADADDV